MTTKSTKELNGSQVTELLKEYTIKLRSLRGRAEELVGKRELMTKSDSPQLVDECVELLDLWNMLRPAATRLAQNVSQTIEHGRIDEMTDLELRLRLPEYEHYIRFLDNRAKAIATNLVEFMPLRPDKMHEIREVVRYYL